MYSAIFFDLDGTILHTLIDIRRALNDALKQSGLPLSYSLKDTKGFIGNGSDMLMHRALGEYDNETNFKTLKEHFIPLYGAYQKDHTKPYNGMPEALSFLEARGVPLFVFSNKPDALAKEIVPHKYPGVFKEVLGASDQYPRKPDPSGMISICKEYGINPAECLYVGDSKTDVETGHNAKMPVALCLWGYGKYKPALLEEAEFLLKKPKDLISVVLG